MKHLSGTSSDVISDFSQIMQRYEFHLTHICKSVNLFTTSNQMQGPESPKELLDMIKGHYINVDNFVRSVTLDALILAFRQHPSLGMQGGRRLVVGPCSILFAEVLLQLAERYPNICFVDNFRNGALIGRHSIIRLDSVDKRTDDFCLILTRNTDAIAIFEQAFGAQNCLNWLERYQIEAETRPSASLTQFSETVSAADKPILFISSKPLGTLNPTIAELKISGFNTFWLGAEDVKDIRQTGYSTPRVSDVPLDGYCIGTFQDLLYLLCTLKRGAVLFHFESVFPPSWDFLRVAFCYASTLAIMRTAQELRPPEYQSRLVLHMYDAIKPGVKNYDAGTACGMLYASMMKEAEGVIFSSYTEAFGDFVENALGQKLNRVHAHRFQRNADIRRPKLTGGYHIAIISVLLEEFWEPSRMGLTEYVRSMLSQGLHIHYYVGINSREKAEAFRLSLQPSEQSHFHLHDPIHCPETLASELSQYHIGWSLFNMQIFNDMTTYLSDQFTRDAMDLFTPTTLPSVIWSCAAAGLPVVCNRSMRGVVDELPEGMAIPLTLSELGNLKSILEQLDWNKIHSANLAPLDIRNNIHRLNAFLDSLHAY